MSERGGARAGTRLLLHVTVHVILMLLYFLPGGLIWNRVEPLIVGVPFGVFVTALLLPALMVGNMLACVLGHWAEDAGVR